jgi:hypothetical protein
MSALNLGMIHSCTVLSSTQDQKLEYSAGSVPLNVGAILTGKTSGATGTVKSIESGYLVLSTVSGTFQEETITDDKGGNATASGPASPHTDGVGTPQHTTTSSSYDCRFAHSKSGGIITEGSGEHLRSEPIVFLPAAAVVQAGDQITGNADGYNKTYRVTAVQPFYQLFSSTVRNYEATLKAVEK